jgi:oxygen-independent coproporphyrinogen-3 oxidase
MELLLAESDLVRLAQWDQPIPRYTSYPPAPSWETMSADDALVAWKGLNEPTGLYIHIPFCHSMCLFCGCSVVLNRRPERQEVYVQTLLKEVDLIAQHTRARVDVAQIHLGGGTPTTLTAEQFSRLVETLHDRFNLQGLKEFAVEVDPRTVERDGGAKLRLLRNLGVDRVSFGIQDADPVVQEAVRRRQSWECSLRTLELARHLGFAGINVDLIYGLPHQTVESFRRTAELIAAAAPDRIALFSYAHVPWMKAHQKALPEESMARGIEKLRLYLAARDVLVAAGYRTVGMDHFARPEDPLVRALEDGTLHRNFQGYTVRYADPLLNLGMSAIGQIGDRFLQNAKELESYQGAIESGRLATERGLKLSAQDQVRRSIIQQIMCRFAVDLASFVPAGEAWQEIFAEQIKRSHELELEGIVRVEGSRIEATQWGRLLIRHVARVFDDRTPQDHRKFSNAM